MGWFAQPFEASTEAEVRIKDSLSSLQTHILAEQRRIDDVFKAVKAVKDSIPDPQELIAGSGITVTDNGDGTITIAAAGLVTGTGVAGRAAYWSGTAAIDSTANYTFANGGAGTTTTLTLANASNTASAHTKIVLKGGGGSGGDVYIQFDPENGGSKFAFGVDNSDNDKLKVGIVDFGAGQTHLMTFNPSDYTIGIGYGMTGASGSPLTAEIQLGCTFGNSPAVVTVKNPNYGTRFQIFSGASQDAQITIGDGSSNNWCFGPDVSDSRTFKFDIGTSLGSATRFSISTAGVVTIISPSSDPVLVLADPSNTAYLGIDTSESGYLKIGRGSAVGTNTVITIDCANTNRVAIGGTMPTTGADAKLYVISNTTTAANIIVRNTISSGIGGGSSIEIEVSNNGYDPYISFKDTVRTWSAGNYLGKFRLNYGTGAGLTIGTVALEVDSTGYFNITCTTDASAVGTASVTLAGGLGVAKKFYLGDDLFLATGKAYRVNGVQVLTNQQAGLGATLAADTAGAAYTGTEQAMLQALNDKVIALETRLKTHGLVAT